MRLTVTLEDAIERQARAATTDIVLVVHDQSLLDGLAYVEPGVFTQLLAKLGMNQQDVYGRYDSYIHLDSAANISGVYEQNSVRKEDPATALALDRRTWEAYGGFKRSFFLLHPL